MATAKKALVIEAALQDGTDASRLAQSLVYDAGVDTPEQDSRSCWQHRPGCQLKYGFPPQTAGASQGIPSDSLLSRLPYGGFLFEFRERLTIEKSSLR